MSTTENMDQKKVLTVDNLRLFLDHLKTIFATDAGTTYNLEASKSSSNGNVNLKLISGDDAENPDSIIIFGTGATTVTSDPDGEIITIHTETPTTITNDEIDAICGNLDTSIGDAVAAEGVSF